MGLKIEIGFFLLFDRASTFCLALTPHAVIHVARLHYENPRTKHLSIQ